MAAPQLGFRPHAAPHYPAPLFSRICVDGRLGTYARFDPVFGGRHKHTVDFDECGKQTLTSDSWLVRQLWGQWCRCATAVQEFNVAEG